MNERIDENGVAAALSRLTIAYGAEFQDHNPKAWATRMSYTGDLVFELEASDGTVRETSRFNHVAGQELLQETPEIDIIAFGKSFGICSMRMEDEGETDIAALFSGRHHEVVMVQSSGCTGLEDFSPDDVHMDLVDEFLPIPVYTTAGDRVMDLEYQGALEISPAQPGADLDLGSAQIIELLATRNGDMLAMESTFTRDQVTGERSRTIVGAKLLPMPDGWVHRINPRSLSS